MRKPHNVEQKNKHSDHCQGGLRQQGFFSISSMKGISPHFINKFNFWYI